MLTQTITQVLTPSSLIMKLAFSFFIQNLWDLLNGLSFLSALALISISMPSSDISKKLMSQILDFVFMNCLMTDRWLDPLLFHKDFLDEA